jgi:hypothetical protein
MTIRPTCPMSAQGALDAGFLDARRKLLEIAAFLDRIERCQDAPAARNDPRYDFLRGAIEALKNDAPERAKRILQLYSKD